MSGELAVVRATAIVHQGTQAQAGTEPVAHDIDGGCTSWRGSGIGEADLTSSVRNGDLAGLQGTGYAGNQAVVRA